MLFPTYSFALFFSLVLCGSWLLMKQRVAWKAFLLLSSYVFYGAWDWRFLGLLVGSTLFNQWMARSLTTSESEPGRRWLVRVAVAGNLLTLGFFKYFDFFLLNALAALETAGIRASGPALQVILPVGISFFTFQALSYVIDVYRREVETSSLLDFAVYLSFFPQLVAGPIVRASEFLPQLVEPRDPRNIPLGRAARLILGGLFKKVVLADTIATKLVDPVFAWPADYSGGEIALAVYGYAAQIYCDFSAYSDIAIGVALLLGFRFPDNFRSPYTARSLQDFWRRWHMTLSRWLRDYLYIPLGGSRGGRVATYRNLMLTMLLGGLWHGASWMFVIWGGIHGGWLALERWWKERRASTGRAAPPDSAAIAVLQRLGIFHLVCLAWVFFRAPDLEVVQQVLVGLSSSWGPAPLVTRELLLAVGVGIAMQYVSPRTIARAERTFSRCPMPAQVMLVSLMFLLIDVLGPTGVAAFIYFQF